jgi:very-short-patch-repair endonuclease
MGALDRTAERIIAGIGANQHGVATRGQLLDQGISRREVARRLSTGLLIPMHRGVYRIGHAAQSIEADYIGAVFACGAGARLCGRAAAHLLKLVRGKPPPPEVLCPTQRSVDGVKTVRTREIDPRDGMIYDRIPVTTVARTLVDLAAALNQEQLARACHEAGVRYRTTPAQVWAVLARRPNSRGAAKLRRVMGGDVRVTLSNLERRFLDLLREHGLPLPQTNRPAGTKRVDCRWPEHRLTVELDSYRYHSSRHAWEQDRRREREAHARGDDIRRFTHDDVFEHPEQMLRELRHLLRQAAA